MKYFTFPIHFHQGVVPRYDDSNNISTFCMVMFTVKILKFGTPQTIAIIVLKIEKFDVTLH